MDTERHVREGSKSVQNTERFYPSFAFSFSFSEPLTPLQLSRSIPENLFVVILAASLSSLLNSTKLDYTLNGTGVGGCLQNLLGVEMLKNLMEEKQLDFNAPLLSVRRFSSTAAPSEGEDRKRIENSSPKIPSLPFYRSELKSGPVRNPGVVPFVWEQIPGKPKDRGGPQSRTLERPPIAPKLPPGRILDVKQQPSEKESEDTNVIRPQTNKALSCRKIFSSSDSNGTKLESSKDGVKEKQNSDSEDSDDAYSDALDTLSRTESFFLNCSISGLSGLEDPDVKTSATFLTEQQNRDFMMGRFLPAAKAMASETPQYAPRKQLVKKVASEDRRPPLNQYRPNIVPQYAQDKREEETEDEADDYADSGNFSAKGCGLFPRFCLKNSFCLLNPVPGMKVRTRVPMSSVHKVSTQSRTVYARSPMETNNEHNWDTVYKHKLAAGLQLHEDVSKLTSESNNITSWSDSQTPDESSPYWRSGGDGISPYRNEAPQSPFHEGMGFLGIPKETKNVKDNGFKSNNNGRKTFRELLSDQSSEQGSGSVIPTVEKTLYIDSVHILETPNSISSSSDSKEMMDSANNNIEIIVKSSGVEETPVVESSLQDIKYLNILKERVILKPKISEVIDADLPSPSERSHLGRHVDGMERFGQDRGIEQESRSLLCSKGDFYNQQPIKSDDQGNSYVSTFQSLLRPPLPNSPSESWLRRTLPSISSRNPSLESYLSGQVHPRNQVPKTSFTDPKWETIVKTSNVHHGHLRFSEELMLPISEQSET
ncbi:hypothetical protein HHK36_023524 [Tetracentron sinense]|uniref:Uncharacterized protein n=1 Tax=Tetracentron sinense TaxID=13715 RepID=A0A834YSJ1_TETSI|nr:hypothetical protein HHK36_023524 [Tetracentron sinense]